MQDHGHTAILAGIGGSGVVYAGTVLARAGRHHFPHVTRFPNFTTAMRGGACECMVIFSQQPIPCPLVFRGDALVVMENSQLVPFQDRLRPGGLLVLESTGLKDRGKRTDVRVLTLAAMEIAISLGDPLFANLVMLGAYIGASRVFSPELVEKEIESRFAVAETGIRAAEKQAILGQNLAAFRRGLEIGQAFAVQEGI